MLPQKDIDVIAHAVAERLRSSPPSLSDDDVKRVVDAVRVQVATSSSSVRGFLGSAGERYNEPSGVPARSMMLAELKADIADERAVNERMRTRAAGLAGFTGIVATLSATLFRQTLDSPLSVKIIAVTVLAVAVLSLAAGVVLLIEIIAPRHGARARVELEAVEKWPGSALVPLEEFEMAQLKNLIDVLKRARQTGETLSNSLRLARIPVIIGITLTVLDAILVVPFTVGLL